MAYNVKLSLTATKLILKLDKPIQLRVLNYIKNRMVKDDSPKLAKILKGNIGLSRYRIGDYRIITKIDESDKTITILDIGHRREIYR